MTGIPYTVTVENRVGELPRIYEVLEEFADRSQLPQPTRRALMLVIEELFTNVVSYGYVPDAMDSVVLTMEHDGEDVALTLCDHGKPFDAARAPRRPDGDHTLDEKPVGGLGLFLVHKFARSVTNRRDGDLNVTEVRLPVGGEAQAAPPA